MTPESNDSSNVGHVRNAEYPGDYVGRPADEEPNWDSDLASKVPQFNEKTADKELVGNVTISGYVESESRLLPNGHLQEPIRATSTGKRSPRTKWNTYKTEEEAKVYYGKMGLIPEGSTVSAPSKNVKKDKEKQPK